MSRFDDGYTGHLFEREMLGQCLAPYRGYLRWREAAQLVRKSQPRAKAPVAARLEREVSAQVGVSVMFFTAVGSALDVMHGCDGFFEFRGVVVTIDITMNPHKDSGKADIVIAREEVENLPVLAGRIARELRSKLSRRM